MPPAGFATPASDRPQTLALARSATGIKYGALVDWQWQGKTEEIWEKPWTSAISSTKNPIWTAVLQWVANDKLPEPQGEKFAVVNTVPRNKPVCELYENDGRNITSNYTLNFF